MESPQAAHGSGSVQAPESPRPAILSSRFARRTRVALACCRCKARKSKCDGAQPSCSACIAAAVECEYPQKPKQQSKSQYIRALEDHVIHLEKRIAALRARHPPEDQDAERGHEPVAFHRTSRSSPGDSPGENDPGDTEIDSLTALLRDVSWDSGGVYLGASSNVFMGKAVAGVIGTKKKYPRPLPRDGSLDCQSPASMFSNGAGNEAVDIATIKLVEVEQERADRMYLGYLEHISTRWPILHTPHIAELHCHKDELVDFKDKVILHLIYANGARYLETTGDRSNFFPERHYNAATQFLEFIVGERDITAVQVLLLLGIYSLRAPKMPGAWNLVGLAMRTCIELGLHRRRPASQPPTIESELECRIFWSAYVLDRLTSLALGRPFALPDRDIDVEIPMDVNEEVRELPAAGQARNGATATTMACFRHTIKIRQLESSINLALYGIDQGTECDRTELIVQIEQRLSEWRNSIPLPCYIPSELGPRPYDGPDYYLHFYYNCQRQLYLPMILSKHPKYVTECAEACVGVCETFKKLHRNSVVGYSMWALQTVFLAGLTLIYTTWIQRDVLAQHRISNALNACNVILYVIVERWPMAKKYRDAFEELKESLDILLAASPELPELPEPQPLPSTSNIAIREMLQDGIGLYDYEQMVLNMVAGGDVIEGLGEAQVDQLSLGEGIELGF